jgi:CyaY protein
MAGIMTESEFHRAVDAVFARVEAAVERQGELDADREGGVLTIECPDGSKVILSRQPPLCELWVAARSGGFHYAWREGAWRDTRAGTELFAALGQILATQGGAALDWE